MNSIITCPKCGKHMGDICPSCGYSIHNGFSVTPDLVVFGNGAGSQTLKVNNAHGTVSVAVSKSIEEWVTVTENENCFNISVEEMLLGEERKGTLVFTDNVSGNRTMVIIKQCGNKPSFNRMTMTVDTEKKQEEKDSPDKKDYEENIALQDRLLNQLIDEYERREENDKIGSRRATIELLKAIYRANIIVQFKMRYPTEEEYLEEKIENVRPYLTKDLSSYLGGEQKTDWKVLKGIFYITIGLPTFLLGLMSMSASVGAFILISSMGTIMTILGIRCFWTLEKEKEAKNIAREKAENDSLREKEEYEKFQTQLPVMKKKVLEEYHSTLNTYSAQKQFLLNVKERFILSETYHSSADCLAELIEEGRADNIKEAINLFEVENHQKHLLNLQREHNAELEREARRQTRALEEQAIAQAQQAEELRRQTEKQQEYARNQQREARNQQREAQKSIGANRGQCATCANLHNCTSKARKPEFCPAYRSR